MDPTFKLPAVFPLEAEAQHAKQEAHQSAQHAQPECEQHLDLNVLSNGHIPGDANNNLAEEQQGMLRHDTYNPGYDSACDSKDQELLQSEQQTSHH